MNWYIAKLVFRIVNETGTDKAQFDEQLWLVTATDKTEALLKARKKGLGEEDSFKSEYTGTVRWQFVDVADLTEMKDLKDGTALYSRVEETDDLAGYMVSVQRKAEQIRNEQLYSNVSNFA